MLEDFRLQVFLKVVQERSFTRAAAELKISQPAVSQNVAELEKMLGRKLFERLRGETVPTSDGEVFLQYVNKLMGVCEEVDNMFSKVQPSTVKISASEELYAYLVAPAIEAFSKIHPEVVFERSLFGDADLTIKIRPSGIYLPAEEGECISVIRMSVSPVNKTDDLAAIREKTSSFDVIFKPSEAFACTRLCRLLKAFLVS